MNAEDSVSADGRMRMPDGSEYAVLDRPEDPATGPLEMEFLLAPDCAAPPPHFHPGGQREAFTVVEGSFELLIGREWHRLETGDSREVAPGVRHTFRNRSGAPARIHNLHDPAHSFERYLRRLHALAIETGATSPTSPRMAIGLARLWEEHADTIRAADAPLRLGLRVLAALGRLARIRPPAPG